MIFLVISDLHLGRGKFFSNGQVNILEDFEEDEKFLELLEYYSTNEYIEEEIKLVLNGDILNLIQIDHFGAFTHHLDEDKMLYAIDQIYKGHPIFFEAIKKFLKTPNKSCLYIIGNHDHGVNFLEVQKRFSILVENDVEFAHNRIVNGVHFEHGHQFEAINAVPLNDVFREGPNGKKILNLPWGTLFCISVLPKLKKDRPLLDKVRPIASYVRWTLFHDFKFFLRMAKTVIGYIIETRTDVYVKQNRNFKTTIKLLQQITLYPNYEKMARRILKKNKAVHTVVMGHTHVLEWRRFPGRKHYFNSGTWNSMPSMDSGLQNSTTKLTYIFMDVDADKNILKSASVSSWAGNWKPYTTDIKL